MFANQFAAHYIAENNIITKDLLLFSISIYLYLSIYLSISIYLYLK